MGAESNSKSQFDVIIWSCQLSTRTEALVASFDGQQLQQTAKCLRTQGYWSVRFLHVGHLVGCPDLISGMVGYTPPVSEYLEVERVVLISLRGAWRPDLKRASPNFA